MPLSDEQRDPGNVFNVQAAVGLAALRESGSHNAAAYYERTYPIKDGMLLSFARDCCELIPDTEPQPAPAAYHGGGRGG